MSNEVKRMRYFDGLFLKQDEFNLEQDYHIRMRRLHNGAFFRWGVIKGLEVQSGPGTKEITVTQGLALSRVTVNGEDLGREIVLPEDTVLDLSGYAANATVCISIAYLEEKADVVEEKGGTEEIHWWEQAVLSHASSEPANKQENIILAKIKMKADGTVDSGSILYVEGGTAVRNQNALVVEGGLHVGGTADPGNDNLLVEGSCTIKGDLVVQGQTTTINTQNLVVEDNIITVNKGTPQNESGLEVYRGGPAEAQLIWNEAQGKWKAGIKGSLVDLAYGANAAGLTDHSVADGLHRHSKLVSANGLVDPVVSVDNSGNVGVGISNPTQKLDVNGTVRANAFIGSGASLTALNGSQITSGVVGQAYIDPLIARKSDVGNVAALTAEIVDARGIKANLGNRLDESLTKGGELRQHIVGTDQLLDKAVTDAKLADNIKSELRSIRLLRVPLMRQILWGRSVTIGLASNPMHMAFDGAHMWVTHFNANNISKINMATNAVAAIVSVGTAPRSIAFDGTHIWVVNSNSNNLSKIDIMTNTVVATVPVGTLPWDLAFDGTHMWVTNYSSNNVSKIDVATNTVVATVAVGTYPRGLAFDGAHIWVANSGANNINQIDIATNAITATIPVGVLPWGVAFDGTHIWVINNNANNVSKIDVNNHTVVATVAVGAFPIGIACDGAYLWVTNYNANTVSKISIATSTVITTLSSGVRPWGAVFDGTHMWMANFGATTINKITG